METLSDKIFELYKNGILSSFQYQAIILQEKEFIQDLKEALAFTDKGVDKDICDKIDRLAGDKLT